MSNSEKVCSNCKWWRQIADGGLGECHQKPPVIIKNNKHPIGYDTVWPITPILAWCGRWMVGK